MSKHTWTEISGASQNDDITVVYLIDSYNHTGFSQVLEELTYNKADPDPLTETPDSLTTYLIGDDVIAQTVDGVTDYLLYDGHGSTRQLAEYDTSVSIVDSYSYDGYGVLLQDDTVASANPGHTPAQATSLLYAGEMHDSSAQMYYNRARYYDPLNGRFNRIDPFAGNSQDPQSLHKYLYAHCSPVMNVDPSGQMTLIEGVVVFAVIATILAGITVGVIAFRSAMITAGARGFSVYVDFSNFNLSGIEFVNGSNPDRDIVKQNILKLMNERFSSAGVKVHELSNQRTNLTTPILSFTNESGGIEFGRNMVGGVRPKIHLGNFRVDKFNGKFSNDSQLAYALAYLASHEVGHSYKLEHLEQSNNIMRSRIVLENEGSGAAEKVTAGDVIKSLLRPSIFTQDQIEVIRNVAFTGKTNQ